MNIAGLAAGYALRNPVKTYRSAKRLYKASGVFRYAANKFGNYVGKRAAIGTGVALGTKRAADSYNNTTKRQKTDNPYPTPKSTGKRKRARDFEPSERPKKMPKFTKKKVQRYRKKGNMLVTKKRKKYRKKTWVNKYNNKFSLANGAPKRKEAAKVLKDTINDTQVVRRVTFSNNALVGRQESNVIGSITGTVTVPGARDELINFFETGAKFYDYTAGAWNTISATSGTQLVTDSSGKKIYIRNIKQNYHLTNQGPTTLEWRIDFLLPRTTQDAIQDPMAEWNGGYSTALGNVAGTWQRSRANVDSQPTDSKGFNFAFKIVKTLKGKLDPGQETNVNFNYKCKRFFDTGYLNTFKSCRYTYPLLPMLTCKGVAADDANDNNVGNVSTSMVKLVGVATFTYNGFVCDFKQQFKRTLGSNLSTLTPGTGNMYSIADAAGTVVDSNLPANFA